MGWGSGAGRGGGGWGGGLEVPGELFGNVLGFQDVVEEATNEGMNWQALHQYVEAQK